MNAIQISTVTKVAGGLFRDNKDFILKRWIKSLEEEQIIANSKEFEILCKEFEMLVNDFVIHLSAGDIESYFAGNAFAAQNIAYNDISFSNFLEAFHLFEDSYMPLLFELPKNETIKCINSLDRLHHKTIAIVCEKYLEIKDNTINILSNLIQLRDDETGGHIERTRDYSVLLAEKMGCSRKFIDEICKASLLHDIGKIGIRDSVLLKPGKLTAEEFERIKEHTRIGAQAIDNIIGSQTVSIGYLPMAKEIALYHHEKYDGSGYPDGLKCEQIPLAARILSLADAYDTIVTERPYKSALPHEEAVIRIKSDSGRHFDPKVVEAFLSINEEFRKLHSYEYIHCLDA